MTKLKCPKGHDIEEKWIDDPMSIWLHCGDDEMLRISDVVVLCDHNDCNRHYFEMDCIKADELLENFEQLKNDQAKNEHKKDKIGLTTPLSSKIKHASPLTSDEDGWIDFDKKLPIIGQKIICAFYSEKNKSWYKIYPSFEYGSQHGTYDTWTKDQKRGWKPADHIPDPTKKVEYCQCDQSLGNALRCSVHHDQACGDGVGCKMEYYCGYCENAIEFGMVYQATGTVLEMHCGCKTILDEDDKPPREEYCDQPFKEGVCIRVKKVELANNPFDINFESEITLYGTDHLGNPTEMKLPPKVDNKDADKLTITSTGTFNDCEHEYKELPGKCIKCDTQLIHYDPTDHSLDNKQNMSEITPYSKQSECEHDFVLDSPKVTDIYFSRCLKCEILKIQQTPTCQTCSNIMAIESIDKNNRILEWKCVHCTNQPKQEEDCTNCTCEKNKGQPLPAVMYCVKHSPVGKEAIEQAKNFALIKEKHSCIDKVIEALLNVEKNCYSDIGFFGREEIPHDRALLRNIIIKLKELKDK